MASRRAVVSGPRLNLATEIMETRLIASNWTPPAIRCFPVLSRVPVGRLTIKAALALGFGLTFGIWLVAGYYFTGRIAETEARAAAVNARYMQAQELLSNVRAQVLLGSVYVRDALLDPHPATAEYRRQVEATYGAVTQALRQYVPILDSSTERERVGRLQNEIDEFRQTMLQVLATDSTRWPSDARVLLRTQVVPKRETVIRVSEDVQALNRSAFVQQQREVAAIYSASQRQLWESLGLSLLASFGVALLAAFYAGRLENRLRLQRVLDEQHAQDLQELSAKLITAQEEERRSIARELHDEVGQVLMAIRVELAVAQRAIEATGAHTGILDDVRSITEGAVTTVRDLSHLLHPALLDDLGLPAAVEWYIRGFSRRHDIRAEVLHDRMDERLAPELEASAYRIIQEALTNIAKHARATTCRVYLQRLPTTVLVTIEDDGAGFDEREVSRAGARAGIGLIGIRERAKQLRGTVRLESAPGRGTRLTLELPARPWPHLGDVVAPDGLAMAEVPATLNG
jgi:signal transduction histidine kinase